MIFSPAERLEILINSVNEAIAHAPHERCGVKFAVVDYDAAIAHFGCSKKTVERDFVIGPFHCEHAFVGGIPVKLARVLAPGETLKLTPATVANMMRPIWEARKIDLDAIEAAQTDGKPWKTGDMIKDGKARMSKWQHRGLITLAGLWPDGHQVAILKCVVDNWAEFIGTAHFDAEVAQDAETGDLYATVKGWKHFKYPELTAIIKYAPTALNFYIADLQWYGKVTP